MASIFSSLQFSLGRLLGRKLPNDYLTIQLEESAKGDICPICAMDGGARYTWLWSFMWESVNDPDVREEFIRGGGLCRADNWAMVEVARNKIKSTLGVAIVYEHLAKVTARALQQGGRPFDIGMKCQACATGNDAARRSGHRLTLASIVNRQPEWLEEAFPLCHRHTHSLMQETPHARIRKALATLQKARIEELVSPPEILRTGPRKGPSRWESALFPRGSLFGVPDRSDNLYIGAIERCPACEALGRREQDLLEEGREVDTDSHSGAYCLGHYIALAERHPALGSSIRSARLREELRFLEMMASSGDGGSGGDSQSARQCPICRLREDAEMEILRDGASSWTGMRRSDDLLCLHHLARIVAMTSGKEREAFLTGQAERLLAMIKDLGGFITLHDYRSLQRPPESPDSPYRWALRFFTSEPALVAPLLTVGGTDKFLPSRISPRVP